MLQSACTTIKEAVNEIAEEHGGWKVLLKKGIKSAIDATLTFMKAVKDGIKFCYPRVQKHLSKIAIKAPTRAAVEVGAKAVVGTVVKEATKEVAEQGAKTAVRIVVKKTTKKIAGQGAKTVVKMAIKEGTKQVATQGVKGLAKAAIHPLGILADLAQVGLEYYGNVETGKKVGAGGNIAAGVLMGATVGGPVGAAVGALAGYLMWSVGESIGDLIEKYLWRVNK